MKKKAKLILKIVTGLAVLGIIGLLVLALTFNSIVRKTVVTVGPRVTQTSFEMESFSMSPFTGKGEIKGLLIGNPEGFKTPSAFELDRVSIRLRPRSLMSDRIIIEEIFIDSPVITYEQGLTTGNNIQALLRNIEEFTGSDQDEKPDKKTAEGEGKKVQINKLVIEGAKVKLAAVITGGRAVTLPLPRIELNDIGKEKEGASVKEVIQQVLTAVNNAVMNTVTGASELLKKGVESLGDAAGSLTDGAKGVTKGVAEGAGKAAGAIKGMFSREKE